MGFPKKNLKFGQAIAESTEMALSYIVLEKIVKCYGNIFPQKGGHLITSNYSDLAFNSILYSKSVICFLHV